MNLLPEQCRAARGLLNWTQEHLATSAGVSRSTIKDFECNRHAIHRATEALLIRALEEGGVRLIPAQEEGAGVRLAGGSAPLATELPRPGGCLSAAE
jgi:transcriptional regulator with XRE-family HTH domain